MGKTRDGRQARENLAGQVAGRKKICNRKRALKTCNKRPGQERGEGEKLVSGKKSRKTCLRRHKLAYNETLARVNILRDASNK